MKFSDFIKLEHACLMLFEKDYREKHIKHGELYPLEIPDDNIGSWDEMLEDFSDRFYLQRKLVLEEEGLTVK